MEKKPTTPEESVSEVQNASEVMLVLNRNHVYSAMVVFAFVAGIAAGYMVWGRTVPVQSTAIAPSQAQAPAVQPANPAPAAVDSSGFTRYEIPTEGFPSQGPEDAEIVLVEFSDFECPFCKRWHDETYLALLDAYPDNIRFVYRNLPLTSIHASAFSSAVASLCAREQDSFWAFHDKLFSFELSLGRDSYFQYAADLELDGESFEACLEGGNYDDIIQADMDFALNMGVRSTPTFFINGLAIVGAQPLSAFKQIIDQELAGEIPE